MSEHKCNLYKYLKKASKADGFWKSQLAGVIIGSLITGLVSAGATYLSTQMTAENQRKQFLLERASSFSEFFALQYLPRSGDVPQECQQRLEECRRSRQSAIQTYLFLPSKVQKELIKSFGSKAVSDTSDSEENLTPEAKSFKNALVQLREWLNNEKDSDTDFNFILPCPDWKNVEEKKCRKQAP